MVASTAVAVVVFGPSGTGKTTIASQLAQAIGWRFADADDYHPAGNVSKMASGIPLNDADRLPWLQRLRHEVIEGTGTRTNTDRSHATTAETVTGNGAREGGGGVVLACSALRKMYRNVLRGGESNNTRDNVSVFFVELVGDMVVVAQRMQMRQHAYMPLTLLASQYATLEPLQVEGEIGMQVSVELKPQELVLIIEAELKRRGLL